MNELPNSPTALVVAAAALAVAIILARAVAAAVEALVTRHLKGDRHARGVGALETTDAQDQQLLVDMATTAENVKEVRDDVADMKKTLVQVGENFAAVTRLTAVHEWRLADIDKRIAALERRAS